MSKIAIISQPDQGVLIDVGGCSTLKEALEHLSSTLQSSNQFWKGNKVILGLGSIELTVAQAAQVLALAKGVDELGGLFVIGTERHESRRIDNQLRGRSGRQGDPGSTKFFVSLEDDLMRIFGGDQVLKIMNAFKLPDDMPIEHGLVSRAIEGAQKKVEGHNFDIRKHTVEYDDVMNQQRKIIYGIRKQLLEASQRVSELANQPKGKKNKTDDVVELLTLKEQIFEKIDKEIDTIVLVNTQEGTDLEKIVDEFSTIVPIGDAASKKRFIDEIEKIDETDKIGQFLSAAARDLYELAENQVGEEAMRGWETRVYLGTLDTLWQAHLDQMDDLRAGIGLRGYAQRDPLIEYKREAFDLFERLVAAIDSEVVHSIFKIHIHQHQPVMQQASPVVDLSRIDESTLLEQVEGPRISEVDANGYNSTGGTRVSISHVEPVVETRSSGTKVKVERNGEIIRQDSYDENRQMQAGNGHGKVGRNDPCWCGSGKKYKKCHYPN